MSVVARIQAGSQDPEFYANSSRNERLYLETNQLKPISDGFLPVLDRQASFARLLGLWLVVIVGNLIDAAVAAGRPSLAADVVGGREGSIAIGRHLVAFEGKVLLISALLAGWLMALGAWLGVSSPRMGEEWLRKLDRNRAGIVARFGQDLPAREARLSVQRWRIFFMACAELFRYRGGDEWFVAHYLFQQADAKSRSTQSRFPKRATVSPTVADSARRTDVLVRP